MVRMVLLAVLGGCSIFKPPPDSYSDTGGDSVTDGETDTDTDPQTGDSGSSGGDDTSSSDALDCDQQVTPTPSPEDCVVRDLTCGETFIDTTRGGTSVMAEGAYSSWFCTAFPAGDFSGNERIYNFTHPGTGTVTFDLDAPCSDLDLIVVRWEFWSTDQTCPGEGHSISECEMAEGTGGGSVDIWANTESNYLVIVDGPQPVLDLFELGVTCP
ncbi:MAG: hypothetical protein ACI8RZ_007109 [Myxococcota bacterium]|jgi:hypothetical protein